MCCLSLSQARKLALLSQGLPARYNKKNAYTRTLNIIEHLGYVQIDTISVVQRAHHHVFWSRNPDYQNAYLEQLVAEKKIFEYWSHAAAFLPMRDYRFTLPRKAAIQSGRQSHWFKKDHRLMADVLQRIRQEGPLMAKDFSSGRHKVADWRAKPAKQALENLFMQGDLMIAQRRGFHKVYDLTERVLPENVDTSMPSEQEHARFLVMNYLKAHGVGNLAEFTYLLKGLKTRVVNAIGELSELNLIQPVKIEGVPYFVAIQALEQLNRRLNRRQVRILSPFDNLLIQRQRVKTIFDFDYQLECYVPADKRLFGYFCLPVLWDGRLVARADCKADRKQAVFQVKHLFVDASVQKNKSDFLAALETELVAFSRFNQCSEHLIEQITWCQA